MSRELRLLLFLVAWIGIVYAYILFFTPKGGKTSLTTDSNLTNSSATNVSLKSLPQLSPFEELEKISYFSNVVYTNSLELVLDSFSFRNIKFEYKGRKYELLGPNCVIPPFAIAASDVFSLTNSSTKFLAFSPNGITKIKTSEGNLFEISRKVVFVSNYVFELEIRVKNLQRKPVVFNGFSLAFSGPLGPNADDPNFAYLYLKSGYIDKVSGGIVETLTTSIFTGTEKFAIKEPTSIAGVWLANSYEFVSLIPEEGEFRAEFLAVDTKHGYNKVVSLRATSSVLEANDSKTYRVKVFLGPKKSDVIGALGVKALYGLEDGGVLKPIYAILSWLLDLFYSLIGNWGLVVIAVSVLIKLLLEPLSIKSAISMKRFQLIAPKIKEIQEKYKNDPKRMNAEMAELYKTYGANPASGCLPLLLQIPIFIAFYGVLISFIELSGQSFLWIRDLTKPDTILYIKAFEGLIILPTSINLLPIIMTVLSITQTAISSAKVQTEQTITMWLIPIIFMFIFWNLPSALVLYWTVQNLLSLIEQYVINKTLKY